MIAKNSCRSSNSHDALIAVGCQLRMPTHVSRHTEFARPSRECRKRNGPIRGHFRINAYASIVVIVVMPAPVHHPPIAMLTAPAMITMISMISMVPKLGTCATESITTVDHDVFSTRDRRGNEATGHNCRDDISELLHVVLLFSCVRINTGPAGTFPAESRENSEQLFRLADVRRTALAMRSGRWS